MVLQTVQNHPESFYLLRANANKNPPKVCYCKLFYIPMLLSRTQPGVLLRTFYIPRVFIQNPPTRLYCKSLYIPLILSRTHTRGSTESPFIFQCFYLEPSQGFCGEPVILGYKEPQKKYVLKDFNNAWISLSNNKGSLNGTGS